MTTDNAPLGDKELIDVLNIPRTTFYRLKRDRRFKSLELTRPLGRYIYSAVKVRNFLAGRSAVTFGRDLATVRRLH